MTADYDRGFNQAATFLPMRTRHERPAIMVAGVLVSVYVDDDRLVISADFDDSDLGVGPDNVTPVTVRMSGEVVFTAD